MDTGKRRTAWLGTILLLVMLVTAALPAGVPASSGVVVGIGPNPLAGSYVANVAPGDTTILKMYALGVTNLAAYDIALSWDSSVVDVTAIAGGTSAGFTTVSASYVDHTLGRAGMVHFTITGVTGNVHFADITVRAVGSAGQSAAIDVTILALLDWNGEELEPRTAQNAVINIIGASQPPQPLEARETKIINTSVSPGNTATDVVQDGDTLSGTRGWRFSITNHGNTTVTNPAISVISSLNPAQFPGSGVSGFPWTWNGIPLASEGRFDVNNLQASSVPVSASPGYTASRTVTPLEVPSGGAQQNVTVQVTPVDSRYANADLFVQISGNVQSIASPGNLSGESIGFATFDSFGARWNLRGLQLSKTYEFGAVLQVANTTGAPALSKPNVRVEMNAHSGLESPSEPRYAITIDDADLQGNITYSVAETDRVWQRNYDISFVTNLSPMFVSLPPPTPAFSMVPQFPADIICTPLVMNTNAEGVEHWFVKARADSLNITLAAHSVNGEDPETVEGRVFDTVTGLQVGGVLSASYPAGTAAGIEVGDTQSYSTVPGRIYRVQVKTPNIASKQSHYRLRFEGAAEAAIKSPAFASLEPVVPVLWFFNAAAGETVQVRVFAEGTPAPLSGNQSITVQWVQAGNPVGPPVTLSGAYPIDQMVPPPPVSPSGKVWALQVQQADSHYRLQRVGGAGDGDIYLTAVSYGQGHISGTVTTGSGSLFDAPVTVNLIPPDGPRAGQIVRSVTTSDGTFSFSNLRTGRMGVEVVPPPGATVLGASSVEVFIACQRTENVQFSLNRPPTASAGPDQEVDENTTVVLSGSGSDPDADPLAFSWAQTGGTPVPFSGADTATLSFAAPEVPAELVSLTLTFQVTVVDAFGGTASDSVLVTVRDVFPAAFQAARTIGYWKNHESQIAAVLNQGPVDLGDTTVRTVSEAVDILSNSSAPDARDSLRAQMLATILNLRNGADPFVTGSDIRQDVLSAKGFLASHPTAVTGGHPDRAAALALKDILDEFNNSGED